MLRLKVLVIFYLSLQKISPVLSNDKLDRAEIFSKLVKDIIGNERVPSCLWANTCWTKFDDFKFFKGISISVQILNPTITLDLPLDENTNKQWIFVDMSCKQNIHFLSKVEAKYFAQPYRWIIVDAPHDSIQNLTILPDSNVIIVTQNKDSLEYVLKQGSEKQIDNFWNYYFFQAFKIGKESPLIYEEFGYWSGEGRLVDVRHTRILSKRRRDLRGHQLIAASVFLNPGAENHTDLDDYNHNTVDTFSKISLLITKHWIESVNATMHVDVHRTWGYRDPKTGQFSGMSGQLQRKEADIGGSIMFFSIDRVDVVEYLTMEIRGLSTFIIRSPPISYVSNIYYLPFTGAVWICSVSLVILCTAATALTLRFHLTSDEVARNMNTSDYLLFAIASCCQMGANILTKVSSARIPMMICFVALLFIYTSFTANIVALLQSTTNSIRTINDLQNPLIGVGVHDTPYHRHYFKVETEPSRKLLYDTKIAPKDGPNAFMNLTYGIQRMREGMFAFNVDTMNGYHEVERTFLEHEKCGLVEIRFMGDTNTWSVIQKHSPYKEILKVNMMKIREHGIQLREASRMDTKRPKCQTGGKSFGSVRLIDCYAALLIFVYGSAASILIFGLEKFMQLKINRMCRNDQLEDN